MITNWHDLNAVLTVATEARVEQLLKEELEQHHPSILIMWECRLEMPWHLYMIV